MPPGLTGSGNVSPAEHPYRWVMLCGVWLIYFCFGLTAAAMAPLVNVIVDDLGLGLAAMGSILGAWPLVYIFAAMPCSAALDSLGLRYGLLAAALVIACSCALRSFATDHLSLFLAVALFGIGGPMISVGAPKLISAWFGPQERGLAMGLYITGPSLGGIAAVSLTNSVLMPLVGHDWRRALLVYAAMTCLSSLVWWLVSSHRQSRIMEGADQAARTESTIRVFARLARLRVVQLVMLMSVGIFAFNHGLNNWLPEILRSGGMDPVRAGYWAAVPTAVGIAGALLIPRLAVGPRRFTILMVLFVCASVATLLVQSQAGPVLTLGLVLQGIARSSMMPITILVLMETPQVGSRNMAAAGGLFFTAAEVGGVLGPLGVGALADQGGGFAGSLYALSAMCVLLVALAVRLKIEVESP